MNAPSASVERVQKYVFNFEICFVKSVQFTPSSPTRCIKGIDVSSYYAFNTRNFTIPMIISRWQDIVLRGNSQPAAGYVLVFVF